MHFLYKENDYVRLPVVTYLLLAVSTLALRNVGLGFVKLAVNPPQSTMSTARSALDLLKVGLSLRDTLTSIVQSLLGSLLGSLGSLLGLLSGTASTRSLSSSSLSSGTSLLSNLGGSLEWRTGLLRTLGGSFQSNLGLLQGERILRLELGEFSLGLVTADDTSLLTASHAVGNLALVLVLLFLHFRESGLELLLSSLERSFLGYSFSLLGLGGLLRGAGVGLTVGGFLGTAIRLAELGRGLLVLAVSLTESGLNLVQHLLSAGNLGGVVTLRGVDKSMPVGIILEEQVVGKRYDLGTL